MQMSIVCFATALLRQIGNAPITTMSIVEYSIIDCIPLNINVLIVEGEKVIYR